ncbi:MAG: NAD/NADP octopine/nopaline dehydrogenase family protein [Deltaproteobacteria bacterium]|jgi:opine dehydrogenase|nr:NAD/NADP octopine/nopaline dehydrogenase family protein [Deltaproteobacteria bacterium]
MSDLSHLKEKPIAVLGGGAVAKAVSADSALAGAKVRICDLEPFASKTLFGAAKGGVKFYGEQLNLYGFSRVGQARYDLVTTDVAEAVRGAGLIIVATPALGHRPFFEKLIPALEDGQFVHVIPDNYGSLILRKMMREAGCTKKIVVGGWSSSPYGSRVDIKGGVILPSIRVYYRAITLRGASLPSVDQADFLASSKHIGAFDGVNGGDGVVGGETVLDTGFSNVNPVLHCPGVILGVGVMENYGVVFGDEKTKFSIYSHAYCPSISRVQLKFYREQQALAQAIGVGIQAYDDKDFFSRENLLGQEYMGKDYLIPFEEQDPIQFGTGPFTIHNRYITEDIPVGCRVYHELGLKYGVKTPVIDSMITLASVMAEKDFFSDGYTLATLGLEGLSKDETLKYLREGALPAK